MFALAVRLRYAAPAVALMLCVAGPVSAFSQDFVIGDGRTAGQQVMAGIGDTGLVRAGGAIETTGDGEHAVIMQAGRQLFVNEGTVATSGAGTYDVYSLGDGGTVRNAGRLLAGGDGSIAILSTGADAYVANSGAIRTLGTASYGVISSGAGANVDNAGSIDVSGIAVAGILGAAPGFQVTNSGSIVAAGEAASGIIWGLGNDGLRVVNSGTVRVSGLASTGIAAGGSGIDIVNAGLVSVSGQASTGILTAFGGASIENTGTVVVSGAETAAIAATAPGSVVTNSGTVRSDQGVAIFFGGANATLHLLGGTAIQGPIVFAGPDNLATFSPGLNALLVFDGYMPSLSAGGRPLVIEGDAVGVIDTTGFASATPLLVDLTGNIADALEARLGGGPGASASRGPAVWASTFGTYRNQAAAGSLAGFRQRLGGLVAGIDVSADARWLGGIFVGTAAGDTKVDGGGERIGHAGVFGGVYAGYDDGGRFLDLSAAVGSLREDGSRRIAENFVLGGVDQADVSYSAVFVSPSVSLGARLPVSVGKLVPSLRLRYAGLFVEGYDEEGAAAALRVDPRDLNVFAARAQLALALDPVAGDRGTFQATFRAGVEGFARNGGDVSASLIGRDLDFADGGADRVLYGFGGADVVLAGRHGLQLQGGVEAGYASDGAFVLSAQARIGKAF